MKIGTVLRELHEAENDLVKNLLTVAERHRVDHDIFHLGRTLAEWSRRHVGEIAAIARKYGEQLDPEPHGELGPVAALREKGSELLGRTPDAGLLMLRDLRDVYLHAAAVLADWEMIGQAAQAIKDEELVSLAHRCQQETTRQMKWANSKIKEASTQVLVA
ncbi:hypothetical protein [Intrasporangium sp. DVR]|uniref:hypothetical protein n=1 Tax=Intrasporangium sp. DVR TaxID=3127867 RepID=UPI00313A61BF